MDKAQAEARIVELVKRIDEIRATLTGQNQVDAMEAVQEEIREMRQITGQRQIVGTFRR